MHYSGRGSLLSTGFVWPVRDNSFWHFFHIQVDIYETQDNSIKVEINREDRAKIYALDFCTGWFANYHHKKWLITVKLMKGKIRWHKNGGFSSKSAIFGEEGPKNYPVQKKCRPDEKVLHKQVEVHLRALLQLAQVQLKPHPPPSFTTLSFASFIYHLSVFSSSSKVLPPCHSPAPYVTIQYSGTHLVSLLCTSPAPFVTFSNKAFLSTGFSNQFHRVKVYEFSIAWMPLLPIHLIKQLKSTPPFFGVLYVRDKNAVTTDTSTSSIYNVFQFSECS